MSKHPLLTANAQWAQDVARAQPDFFLTSAEGQKPHTLWIGCADSRVPESVITGAKPGDIFVHRNIANQFHADDANALSVLKYSVDMLQVQHVVVVGHSNCGGAAACLGAIRRSDTFNTDGSVVTVPTIPEDAPLNRWLITLTELADSLGVADQATDVALATIVRENVKLQVKNVCQTDIIRTAWSEKRTVSVHGWVYDLATGKLEDLGISRSS